MLKDDRKKYAVGALAQKAAGLLKLRKGATKAPGRAKMEADLSEQLDTYMKEHMEDLAKLDELKKTGSQKELQSLKKKIRSDTEMIVTLEESLEAIRNYSPGGRRPEFSGGLLERESFALGSMAKKGVNHLRDYINSIHYERMGDKPLSKQIAYLEGEMESLYELREKAKKETIRLNKELNKKNITTKEKNKLLEDLQDSKDEIFDINSELDNLTNILEEKGVNSKMKKNMGGILERESFALGSIASKALKKMKSMPKKTKDSKVQDKSFREEIVELEDEMDNLIQIRRSLEDEKRRKIKELGIPRTKALFNDEVLEIEDRILSVDFEIDDVETMLKKLGVKPSAENIMERIRNNEGGLLGREPFAIGRIVKRGFEAGSRTAQIRKLEREYDRTLRETEKLRKELKKARKNKNMNPEELEFLRESLRMDGEYLVSLQDELKVLREGTAPRGKEGINRFGDDEGFAEGGRASYALGSIVKKFIKRAEKNKAKLREKEGPESLLDDSTDMASRGTIDMEDAIKMLDDGEDVANVEMFLVASGYTKKDAKKLIDIYRTDIDVANPKMTQDEIFEEYDRLNMKEGGPGIEALRKEVPEVVERMGYEDGGSMDDQMMMVMNVEPMESDEKMEDNYTQFIMEEALNDEEEDMLMSKLEKDKELQMLFDKVIDVAQEFAGSGPVEGPGSGVSDSIPARLSDGEFVFTAKATEEIGADELMRMMKDAEANADKRQQMANGGEPEEETMTRQPNEPDVQEIRVVKETVDSTGRMMEDEDEISKDIKSQMMLDPNQRHVRS